MTRSSSSWIKSILQGIYGLIELNRPFDGLIVGSAAVLGAIVSTRSILPLDKVLLGLFTGAILLGAMDVFNDYHDLDIDQISKPWRPLPRGAVHPTIALISAIIETFIGLSLALFFGWPVLIGVFFGIGLAFAYSLWFKPVLAAKNLFVAISLSMASIAGALAVGGSFDSNFLLVQIIVFIAAFTFEIHKDLGDIEGDVSLNVTTIPIKIGTHQTVILIMLGYFSALAIALSFIFWITFDALFFMILVITAILFLYIAYLLFNDAQRYIERTRRIVTILLGLVILGLIRLFLI
ncbi:MAG: UbiA family prenyltransferase [Candidatus Hodarchaeales archaeon]|jgi:4-hydroxybenzoate polyprenyltransferase